MEAKLDVRNIDLRNTQEMVEDNMKLVRKTGRKVALAYAGLFGIAYDEAKAILKRGREMVEEAESRGEKIEDATRRQLKSARRDVEKRLKGAEKEVNKVQKRFTKQLRRSEAKAEGEIDTQVERVLERLGIPSRERIVKLSAEIEALSRKIDREIVQAGAEKMAAPMAGYTEMTAKEVVALLGDLSPEQLAEVKAFEAAHDNRITIIREVERLLEAADKPGEAVLA